MAELYATDIPGFTNYMRMTPEFFEMIKTRLEPCLARQATNYRAPISVGEKLALTIRYLATGESCTSLSCQFRVGRSTLSKFLPEVCRVIHDEFTREYLRCPTTPGEWKELEMEFGIRLNVPHALGALDGKHVALTKPNNSGALYHNYKGFFSIVMLALVDGQYKFRWVDAGTARSCSDAQIFNACQLKRRIEDGRIGFPDPAPITQGSTDVRDVVMTCVVLQKIQYQGQHGGQEPGDDEDDDVPGDCRLIGGAAGGGPDRKPTREAKRQRDYLKDYSNNEGVVACQDGRI